MREDVARIMAGPTRDALTDEPADWYPAVAEIVAREREG